MLHSRYERNITMEAIKAPNLEDCRPKKSLTSDESEASEGPNGLGKLFRATILEEALEWARKIEAKTGIMTRVPLIQGVEDPLSLPELKCFDYILIERPRVSALTERR